MRKNFNEMKWDVVVVNGCPYMYNDMRIERDSVPAGLVMYEVADADCDGRFCRISSRILVNFLCTLIGKEALPMNDGTYYCKRDNECDKHRNEFVEALDKQLEEGIITEKEYEDKLDEYDSNYFPEDDDGWFIEHDISVSDYLANYDKYFEDIAVVK